MIHWRQLFEAHFKILHYNFHFKIDSYCRYALHNVPIEMMCIVLIVHLLIYKYAQNNSKKILSYELIV